MLKPEALQALHNGTYPGLFCMYLLATMSADQWEAENVEMLAFPKPKKVC